MISRRLYENYLAAVEPEAADDAQARLASWLDDGDDTAISRHVRIVLVSGRFDREITTTVLWLTDLYGLEIRCVRLTPYRVGDLDLQLWADAQLRVLTTSAAACRGPGAGLMSDVPCPILTTLDVAAEILARYRHLHSDPNSAAGMISLHRETYQRMHDVLPCQAAIDSRGQLVRSLGAVSNDVMSLIGSANVRAVSAIQLDASRPAGLSSAARGCSSDPNSGPGRATSGLFVRHQGRRSFLIKSCTGVTPIFLKKPSQKLRAAFQAHTVQP